MSLSITLNYFDGRTTNGFTEGCHTKNKVLERVSYGLRDVDVHWSKVLLGAYTISQLLPRYLTRSRLERLFVK